MNLWQMDQVLREVRIATPLLACWESKTHPAQIRLQAHLSELKAQLGDLDSLGPHLGLEYHVDVEIEERLQRHYDLENYLTPIVAALGSHRFRHVAARKSIGTGSRLMLGSTKVKPFPPNSEWSHFNHKMSGSVQSKNWKADLREAINRAGVQAVEPGPVAVEMLWAVDPTRNWVNLWKPTGDAMGPILGYVGDANPFSPQDDRITVLGLHLHHDPHIGFDVDVSLWWKPFTS